MFENTSEIVGKFLQKLLWIYLTFRTFQKKIFLDVKTSTCYELWKIVNFVTVRSLYHFYIPKVYLLKK